MSQKIGVGAVFFLLIAGYVMAGLLGIQAHNDPAEMDTTAYLSASYQIKETGGIFPCSGGREPADRKDAVGAKGCDCVGECAH